MKKIVLLISLFFIFVGVSHAANQYGCTALIGGATGALDALDITGASTPNADNLAEGDSAQVTVISGATVIKYFYIFDASGTDAESSPEVIRPDDYATAGVWLLTSYTISSLTASGTITANLFSGSGASLTAIPGANITADTVLEAALDATNAPTDNYLLSYDSGSSGFTWVIAGTGSGDITGVGDCASGDCYDGSSDGGTYARLYDGDSNYFQLDVENISADYILSLPSTIGTSGQLMQSDGDNTTSWTSSLSLAFRDTVAEALWRDSDAAGAADADEDAGSIKYNMSTVTEDAEVSDFYQTYFDAGTESSFIMWDASDWAMYTGVGTDAAVPGAAIAGYERLKWDFNTATDNEVAVSSDSGATDINFGSLNLKTTGNLLGSLVLDDDQSVEIMADHDGMDDDEYNGVTITGLNAGEGLTQWNLVRIHNDADPWHLAEADVASEFPAQGIVVATVTDTNEAKVLVQGVVRNEGWTGLTIGGAVYLGEASAGSLTQTAPSTSGDCVQIVGFAISDSEILFDFSRPYQEVE